MEQLNIISWNVNGIRAVDKKEAFKWIDKKKVDILGVQETKSMCEQIPDSIFDKNYKNMICSQSAIKGRSGTSLFADVELCHDGICERIDILDEGRINEIHFEFDGKDIVLFNIYFPNGQSKDDRLNYKMEFYDRFLDYCEDLKKDGKSIIAMGDFNTAHTEIDLTNPKANSKISGFLPMEREWISKFIDHGYIDTFREIHGDITEKYSWWSYRHNAREKNVGWRIDYVFITEDLKDNLADAFIWDDIFGSDHCPIGVTLKKA